MSKKDIRDEDTDEDNVSNNLLTIFLMFSMKFVLNYIIFILLEHYTSTSSQFNHFKL